MKMDYTGGGKESLERQRFSQKNERKKDQNVNIHIQYICILAGLIIMK